MSNELEENRLAVAEKIAKIEAVGGERPYNIVPTLNVRCLVPCLVGHCICNPDITIHGNYYTVVDKVGTTRFSEWYKNLKKVLRVE